MIGKLPIIIDELLRYRESPRKVTSRFQELKHNNYLCPVVEQQMNRILDCFIKFHSIAYDIQGINDRGTDIVLRYSIASETGDLISKYVSFQIKSYDDLSSKTYLKDLKAQYFEAKGEYRDSLVHYYVLLCTDKIQHINKIRQIKKIFSISDDTTVIDPIYMATFLRLNPIRISSIVSAVLRDDDIVYEKAFSDLSLYTPTEIAVYTAVVLEMTITSEIKVDIDRINNNAFIRDIYSKVPDYPRDYYFYLEEATFQSNDEETESDLPDKDIEEYDDRKRDFYIRFSEDVDVLSEGLFDLDATDSMVKVNLEYSRPIQAIILDGMVRYNCSPNYLLEYVFTSLGIMERFGFDDMQHAKWLESAPSK